MCRIWSLPHNSSSLTVWSLLQDAVGIEEICSWWFFSIWVHLSQAAWSWGGGSFVSLSSAKTFLCTQSSWSESLTGMKNYMICNLIKIGHKYYIFIYFIYPRSCNVLWFLRYMQWNMQFSVHCHWSKVHQEQGRQSRQPPLCTIWWSRVVVLSLSVHLPI